MFWFYASLEIEKTVMSQNNFDEEEELSRPEKVNLVTENVFGHESFFHIV